MGTDQRIKIRIAGTTANENRRDVIYLSKVALYNL